MKLSLLTFLILSILNIVFAQKTEVFVQKGLDIIYDIKFTPDGKYISATGDVGSICFWDIKTKKQFREIHPYIGGEVLGVGNYCFTKDSKLMAVMLSEGDGPFEVQIWKLDSFKLIKTMECTGSIFISFLDNSTLMYIPDSTHILTFYNCYTDKVSKSNIKLEFNSIFCTNPNANLISYFKDSTITVYDLKKQKVIKNIIIKDKFGNIFTAGRMQFSPDNKYLIFSSPRSSLFYEINNDKYKELHDCNFIKINPEKNIITYIDSNRILKCCNYDNFSNCRVISEVIENTDNDRYDLSPDGNSIVITKTGKDENSAVKFDIINLFQKKVIYTFNDIFKNKFGIELISINPNNYEFISRISYWGMQERQRLFEWNIKSGEYLNRIISVDSLYINEVNYSNTGKFIVMKNDDCVYVYEITTEKLVFKNKLKNIADLKATSDDSYLGCLWDNYSYPKSEYRVKIWNINDFTIAFDDTYNNYLDSKKYDFNFKKIDINKSYIKNTKEENWGILEKKWNYDIFGYESFPPLNHCVSNDSSFFVFGTVTGIISIWDKSYNLIRYKQIHNAQIIDVGFTNDNKFVISGSWDGTIKICETINLEKNITIIPVDTINYVVITNDNYYDCTKNGLKTIIFRINNKIFPPEQFDLQYNRPDIVLERIGYASKELIESYRNAYEKRLRKMKFTPDMFNEDFHLPEIEVIANGLPISTDNKEINFTVKANDTQYRLDRVNVYVNDVPVYGTNGIDLRNKSTSNCEQDINLELSEGNNKIQVSVLNDKGVESLKESFEITYNGPKKESKKYFIGIGVSNYQDSKLKLNYASKDINDLANAFKENDKNTEVITLIDEQVIKDNIFALNDKLMKTNVDDEVIISLSGHGFVSKKLDFFYATYDMDIKNPEKNGLMYDDLDKILDGIPARKKLLLIDACNSGELDKENTLITENKNLPDNVKGIDIVVSDVQQSELGLQNSFELMQEMFVNLTRGNGAVVISAAGGKQFAYEGGQWNNGVFTYCILKGLKEKTADKNSDGQITVTELKDYVSTHVEQLTNGKQKPTSRSENLEFDFRVW